MRATHMTPSQLDETPAVDLDWYLAVSRAADRVDRERELEQARKAGHG